MSLHAIETHYKGYRFRSRLEARWAVFLDALAITWAYEHEGYNLDGVWYLPDFWLPAQECWLEVKGKEATEDECERAGRLAVASKKSVHILWGDIGEPDGETCGIQTFAFDERITPDRVERWPHLDWHSLSRFCVCPICGKAGITTAGNVSLLPCGCVDKTWGYVAWWAKWPQDCANSLHDGAYWWRKMGQFLAAPDAPRIQEAIHAARSARFEHGEGGE